MSTGRVSKYAKFVKKYMMSYSDDAKSWTMYPKVNLVIKSRGAARDTWESNLKANWHCHVNYKWLLFQNLFPHLKYFFSFFPVLIIVLCSL